MTTTRNADHLLITDSGIVHAAADCHTRPYHVLACNGRAMRGAGVEFHHTTVTCRACIAGIRTGRIVLPDTLDAAIAGVPTCATNTEAVA